MNKVMLMGRLTRDPEIRQTQQENSTEIARYTLAVDRRVSKKDGEQSADFISCIAFGKSAEFAEKYFHQGIKILVTGRIRTGSYTKQDGSRVYTTDVVVEDQEFAESKAASGTVITLGKEKKQAVIPEDDFMNIPDDIDEELPFH